MKQLERKHIITLIKSLFVNKISESIIIYFNNMRTNSSVAINENLEYTRYLIAQYYDFLKNENNFIYKRLCNIYSYLERENFNIPYLQKEINEKDFIEVFDYINNNFNYKNKGENFSKITDIVERVKIEQEILSR